MRVGRYFNGLASTALGRNPAGRALTVFPEDVFFLVSYFRSGTWSCFLAGNLIQQDEPSPSPT